MIIIPTVALLFHLMNQQTLKPSGCKAALDSLHTAW